jgi:STAS domain
MTWCILDMKRVNALDSTGAGILVNIHKRLVKTGKHLYMTHLENHPLIAGSLKAFKLFDALGEASMFQIWTWLWRPPKTASLKMPGTNQAPPNRFPWSRWIFLKTFFPKKSGALKMTDRLDRAIGTLRAPINPASEA